MMTTQALLQTPLYSTHVALGAKMVPFAGWQMPLQYTKVLEEHRAVRNAAGLFDISHMGLLTFSGESSEVQAALNALVPQDLLSLPPSKAVYTQLLTDSGGMLDDIIVYHLPTTPTFCEWPAWLVICNASNCQKVTDWLTSHLPPSIQVTCQNPGYSLLALQGPAFEQVLRQAGLSPLATLPKRFHIEASQVGDVPVLLARTGYTGEDGVEIVVANAHAQTLWQNLIVAGKPLGLQPVGLAARDTLRLEAVYPLYGHELDETLTPLEAGLGWSVKLDQAADFIGKAALQAQRQTGWSKHLTCFEMTQKAIPRPHDLLYDKDGNLIGEVTSGSISPTLNRPIGVGYVSGASPLLPQTPLFVGIRGQQIPAIVVKKPFYQR